MHKGRIRGLLSILFWRINHFGAHSPCIFPSQSLAGSGFEPPLWASRPVKRQRGLFSSLPSLFFTLKSPGVNLREGEV